MAEAYGEVGLFGPNLVMYAWLHIHCTTIVIAVEMNRIEEKERSINKDKMNVL